MDELILDAPAPATYAGSCTTGRRVLNIYCDGGFGNRFNGLVSGLAIAELAGLEPRVIWPTNNWCGAAFESIFDAGFGAERIEKARFAEEIDRYQLLMGWDDMGFGRPYDSPLKLESAQSLFDCLSRSPRDLYYDCVLRPAWLSLEQLRAQVLRLPFQPGLGRRVQACLAESGLVPGTYFGLQIRKTDFGAKGVDDSALLDMVAKAQAHRFFVCSDDPAVELRFSRLPNVAVHPKGAHVERLDGQGGWNQPVADSSGRVLPFNVRRSAESVLDAMVDLLLLSHSRIVRTSQSTFLDVALLLQACR